MPFTEEEVADIVNQYEQVIKDSESSIEFASQQIVILEAEKEKLQKPAKILDQSLYKRVKDIKTSMNDLSDLWEEEWYEPDEEYIDDATRCGIVWCWNKEYGLGDPIDMDDVVDYEHKGDYWCCQGITWFSIKRK